jgi:guanylate kinase
MMNNNSISFNHPPDPLVIVLSGPSGVGKDAILNRLKEQKYPCEFIITMTTRPQRSSEKQQVDYNFVSVDKFQELLKKGGLLEWAQVYGHLYGVPKQAVKEALAIGKDTIIKVDVQGAASIKRVIPEAVFIFIFPPSMDELTKRLRQRRSETPSAQIARLKAAEDEMRQSTEFDYLVCNQSDKIDLAVKQIQAIITAEKCRAKPRKIAL